MIIFDLLATAEPQPWGSEEYDDNSQMTGHSNDVEINKNNNQKNLNIDLNNDSYATLQLQTGDHVNVNLKSTSQHRNGDTSIFNQNLRLATHNSSSLIPENSSKNVQILSYFLINKNDSL